MPFAETAKKILANALCIVGFAANCLAFVAQFAKNTRVCVFLFARNAINTLAYVFLFARIAINTLASVPLNALTAMHTRANVVTYAAITLVLALVAEEYMLAPLKNSIPQLMPEVV